ncbi:MAG: hypothetical protein DCF13_13715 [Flavobacteriaceae bacterium]|nr:MAG: hypothetical protein DCF13_13715 [Flavobacteriaceae bacterium]
MQIRNKKVNSINQFISKNLLYDSDFWTLGNGSIEIQNILNTFKKEDWNKLGKEVPKWKNENISLVIESVAFGFDGMFEPSLDKKSILNAAEFLLDIFISIDDFEHRNEISYFSFFINQSNSREIKKLSFMENWMMENGYEEDIWIKSKVNPIGNIREAIKKASQ